MQLHFLHEQAIFYFHFLTLGLFLKLWIIALITLNSIYLCIYSTKSHCLHHTYKHWQTFLFFEPARLVSKTIQGHQTQLWTPIYQAQCFDHPESKKLSIGPVLFGRFQRISFRCEPWWGAKAAQWKATTICWSSCWWETVMWGKGRFWTVYRTGPQSRLTPTAA